MKQVIGLFDPLPQPTSTEHVVVVGTGTFTQTYSAVAVDRQGTLDWKLVGWS